MDIVPFTSLADAIHKLLQSSEIAFADLFGSGLYFRDSLKPLELNRPLEGEVQFIRVQHMEENDFRTSETNVLDTLQDRIDIIQQIRDHNHNSSSFDLSG